MHGTRTMTERKTARVDLASQVMREVRKAERITGDGRRVGGTGFTILKYQEPTISRLISAGKIGHEEMRAITEIEAVYGHLCSKLILRGALFAERLDRHQSDMPSWFLDAYFERYKPWANDWSKRKKTHNDQTLEIVYDILFSQRTGKEIDREKGWQNGLAMRAFLGGIRDYAAVSGWVGGTVGAKWSEMARQNFSVRRMSRVVSRGNVPALSTGI